MAADLSISYLPLKPLGKDDSQHSGPGNVKQQMTPSGPELLQEECISCIDISRNIPMTFFKYI